jgi:hypothetical protein
MIQSALTIMNAARTAGMEKGTTLLGSTGFGQLSTDLASRVTSPLADRVVALEIKGLHAETGIERCKVETHRWKQRARKTDQPAADAIFRPCGNVGLSNGIEGFRGGRPVGVCNEAKVWSCPSLEGSGDAFKSFGLLFEHPVKRYSNYKLIA